MGGECRAVTGLTISGAMSARPVTVCPVSVSVGEPMQSLRWLLLFENGNQGCLPSGSYRNGKCGWMTKGYRMRYARFEQVRLRSERSRCTFFSFASAGTLLANIHPAETVEASNTNFHKNNPVVDTLIFEV